MERKKKKTEVGTSPELDIAGSLCREKDCFVHKKIKTRGRTFKGVVTKKFPKRVTLEFGRMIYLRKYERYAKGRTKIHARIPECMEDKIKSGDTILVQECRPLSKIIHFAVIGKIDSEKNNESGEKIK